MGNSSNESSGWRKIFFWVIVSKDGISVNLEKIKAKTKWPIPRSVREE